MTQPDHILKAVGWDDWGKDDIKQPWLFQADDGPEPAFDVVRFLVVRNDKALAVEVGFHDGPLLVIRAFDGARPAIVGSSSYEGAFLNVTVAETLDTEEVI